MTAQVAISETGSARAGMNVARADLRNAKITSTTRPAVINSVSSTSATALRIEIERSLATSSDTAEGSCLR